MALQTAALNAAANGVAGVAAYMSLHTAAAGSGGANEVTGGGYVRKAVTWNAASGAIASASGTPIAFTGPAAQAVAEVGLWTAVSGGTFLGSDVPTGDLAFNAAGELNVTAATITAANG